MHATSTNIKKKVHACSRKHTDTFTRTESHRDDKCQRQSVSKSAPCTALWARRIGKVEHIASNPHLLSARDPPRHNCHGKHSPATLPATPFPLFPRTPPSAPTCTTPTLFSTAGAALQAVGNDGPALQAVATAPPLRVLPLRLRRPRRQGLLGQQGLRRVAVAAGEQASVVPARLAHHKVLQVGPAALGAVRPWFRVLGLRVLGVDASSGRSDQPPTEPPDPGRVVDAPSGREGWWCQVQHTSRSGQVEDAAFA